MKLFQKLEVVCRKFVRRTALASYKNGVQCNRERGNKMHVIMKFIRLITLYVYHIFASFSVVVVVVAPL